MTTSSKNILKEKALHALKLNDRGSYFVPCKKMYPHQWLWDSCFIAIGLAEAGDTERAKTEILSLLKNQWHNGMIPHMIFSNKGPTSRAELSWKSSKHPAAPHGVSTSAITQPPLLAEAVWRIANNLSGEERENWLKLTLPKILAYHSWLYRARDPKEEGVVFLVHPWESGADGSPVWKKFIDDRTYSDNLLAIVKKLGLDKIANRFRSDAYLINKDQRLDSIQAIQHYMLLTKLRKLNYQSVKIHKKYKFKLEDIHFNSILVRANWLLNQMSGEIDLIIPPWLRERFEKSVHALELMYDEQNETYYSRTWEDHKFVKAASFYDFMPLYAGTPSLTKAKNMASRLKDYKLKGASFGVPTIPVDSPLYREDKYWEGPSWPMINWLLIDGLKRYGLEEDALNLREQTLNMVDAGGFAEYFNAFSGAPLGAKNFAPTAGITLSLVSD